MKIKLSGRKKFPILLVYPETREIIANQNNVLSFEKAGLVFQGSLPLEINIANTALDWRGERWTMVMLPLPENEFKRNKIIIHELFHQAQTALGFIDLKEATNSHLNTYEGRMLLSFRGIRINTEKLVTQTKSMVILFLYYNFLTLPYLNRSNTN